MCRSVSYRPYYRVDSLLKEYYFNFAGNSEGSHVWVTARWDRVESCDVMWRCIMIPVMYGDVGKK